MCCSPSACRQTQTVTLQANIKYEEMREKAGEAVPDKIKEMVQSHSNDMNAEVCCQCSRHDCCEQRPLFARVQPVCFCEIPFGITSSVYTEFCRAMDVNISLCLQHSSKATSQHYDSAKETGPNADIGKVEGVYEGGRSGNQGENLLDKTRESAYNKMGGGMSGANQTGNNVTGSNQTGRLGQGTQGSTSGY